jgi:Flp pilus assembly protein TadD
MFMLSSHPLLHRTLPALALGALLVAQTGCGTLSIVSKEAFEDRRNDKLRNEMIERQRGREAALSEPSKADELSAADHLRAGDRLRDSGDISKAALSYLRAQWADDGASTVDSSRRLAFLALRKEPTKSLELFTELLADTPDDPLLLTGLAVAHIEHGDLDRARMALHEALEVSSDESSDEASNEGPRSQIFELLGVVYDRLGRHVKARHHYQAALGHRPSDARLLNNLGVSYLLGRNYAEAATQFEEAVAAGASDPATHNNLGLAYGFASRYSEAMREFRRAGTQGDALNNMGYLLFLQGRHTKALDFYEKALLSNDTNERRVLENIALLERVRAETH